MYGAQKTTYMSINSLTYMGIRQLLELQCLHFKALKHCTANVEKIHVCCTLLQCFAGVSGPKLSASSISLFLAPTISLIQAHHHWFQRATNLSLVRLCSTVRELIVHVTSVFLFFLTWLCGKIEHAFVNMSCGKTN